MTKRIGRPPGVESEETRTRILESAISCFAAHGFAATTNKMIADASGLTAAAVYFHFGGKEGVFGAVYAATADDIFRRYQAAIADEVTFVGKANALLNASLEVLRERPDLAKFIAAATSESSRHPELAEVAADRRWRDIFDEIAAAGVQSGELDPSDRAAMRGMLSALVTGLSDTAARVEFRKHAQIIRGFQRLLAGRLLNVGHEGVQPDGQRQRCTG